ncbi:hybrid sensor histidine kinase/response regulator transcription factor [Spirosoma validum]|uniref:histidine kinase n=1 Tax=Spirosoma validum TaxID=2771355 RepID=A0A927B3M5_9BACT|nr:ATP-binding protein [Spirosoma validum]MBD2754713.1 response regulator [Spirosoma validum]
MQPGWTNYRRLIPKNLLLLSIFCGGKTLVWAQSTLPQPEIISNQQGLPQGWTIILYITLISVLIYGFIRIYLYHQQTRQLKAMETLKARLFTGVTHEFRTPLTLILASVDQLKQRLQHDSDQQQLEIINQNVTQLLARVNQLTDLSKAEANVLKVRESQGNLIEFLSRTIQSFETHAMAKGIQVLFRAEKTNTNYWFDPDKLERIVSNLLANALKFTPIGGRVIVDVTTDEDRESVDSSRTASDRVVRVHLEISDNGIGISPEKIVHIFDRFFWIDDDRIENQDGMGIGLALVKELVEIQNGTIQVSSKVSIGTTFLVDLPYRIATAESFIVQHVVPVKQIEEIQSLNIQEQRSNESPIILIVEDNPALSDFIADNLPVYYKIHQVKNGAEGWEKALSIGPDVVISDVLMPIMDGYELCQRLKTDSRTSHIPVILLTAKTSIDSRLRGLSTGADDYITKPFYVQELQLRIRNLLEQRRQMRQRVAASLTNPSALPTTTDPLVEKLCQLVEDHLDDSTFGVDQLILASGISRMNLHRKLKALVDLSTGEFIRNYRLKRAAQLLRQGRSVSETAYLVGFEDPSYFARSFRKVYQTTPSDFSRRN